MHIIEWITFFFQKAKNISLKCSAVVAVTMLIGVRKYFILHWETMYLEIGQIAIYSQQEVIPPTRYLQQARRSIGKTARLGRTQWPALWLTGKGVNLRQGGGEEKTNSEKLLGLYRKYYSQNRIENVSLNRTLECVNPLARRQKIVVTGMTMYTKNVCGIQYDVLERRYRQITVHSQALKQCKNLRRISRKDVAK